jgi:hypothetical protein
VSADVKGHCPECGNETLFLASGGYITCSWVECRNPTAAADVLDDGQVHHVVVLGKTTFTVRHPLRERLGDALMECDLHRRIAALDGPPRSPGRYTVMLFPDGRWVWLDQQEVCEADR